MFDRYGLTPMQEGMLFQFVSGVDADINVQQFVCTLNEPIKIAEFQQAWTQLISRHEALRTEFHWLGLDRPEQVVLDSVELPFEVRDLRHVPESDRSELVQRFLTDDRNAGFDLSQAPLMRVTVLQLAESEFTCVWTYHHIILDGRSRYLLTKELFSLYEDLCKSKATNLPSSLPFRSHIQELTGRDVRASKEFWSDRLSGLENLNSLAMVGIDQVLTEDPQQASIHVSLDEDVTTGLRKIASENGVTVNTMVQAAWSVLLSRYSGQSDIVFGEIRSGRYSKTLDNSSSIGLFINNLPVRVQVDPDREVADWLRHLRKQSVETRSFEHTSLAEVRSWSRLPSDVPLFDSLIMFERSTQQSAFDQLGEGWQNRRFKLTENTGYPVVLLAWDGPALELELLYQRQIFGAGTTTRMIGHLTRLLESLADGTARRVSDLVMLPEGERIALLDKWNQSREEFSDERTIHEIFSEQATASPSSVALRFRGQSMTYGELDGQSDQLAGSLMSRGITSGNFIGLCAEPGFEMIVGILGILKAGGCYVPLDPKYPPSRLQFIAENAGARAIVVQSGYGRVLEQVKISAHVIDLATRPIGGAPAQVALPDIDPHSPAYVIYTSGSTGQPKGVSVSHRNVTRLFQATHSDFAFGEADTWSLFHSFAFDFSVWEIWGALLHGGKLVIVPTETRTSVDRFYDLLVNERVTFLSQTPTAFRELIGEDAKRSETNGLALSHIVLGGEALDPSMLQPWFERQGDSSPEVVNMYGITETTVHVTYRPIRLADASGNVRNVIGRPLRDVELLILDQSMNPVPIGVPGEMFVGGGGVSAGYLGLPDLTSQRFVPHPFEAGKILYRSGDVARHLPGGDIEYLGRADKQIKIRGFRIEPGEIESVLAKHPEIDSAHVIAREDQLGDTRLVAYLMMRNGTTPATGDLIELAERELPGHMVPGNFVAVEKLPTTANGKLDVGALPLPDRERPELSEEFTSPVTSYEKDVTSLWSELLQIDDVGVNDNFFELGGHSLLLMRLCSMIETRLSRKVSVTDAFRFPTVRSMARHLEGTDRQQTEVQTSVANRAARQRKAFAAASRISRR